MIEYFCRMCGGTKDMKKNFSKGAHFCRECVKKGIKVIHNENSMYCRYS